MDLIVLDKNLDSLAIIDTYKSLIWTDRFQKCGDFELVLPVSKTALENIKQDYYLWSNHSEHVMIIEKILINNDSEGGNLLTVTGRSLESIIDRRIVWGMKTLSGNFQNGMRTLFEENIISPSKPERKIDNFVFLDSEDSRITDLSIETQYTGDNLYDIVTNQCAERGIGFKVTVNDQKQFIFQFYAGDDHSYDQTANPYVVFSPNFENISESNYMESKSAMKNVTLVGGEGEGSARRYTAVGNTSGLERRELFTDARDISSDNDVDFTESFTFSQYPSQVFNNTTKQFVSDPLFNSSMVNVAAYAGQTIRITIPKYTGSDGQTSKYATILVDSSKKYISTLKAWEKDTDSETTNRGTLETYEIKLPDDASYLYTSMYSQKAIDSEVYSGNLTDFACSSIKVSNDEYIRLLRQRGKEKLAENKNIVSFDGEAEATMMFRYGEDFFIGDIVQVSDEYGHEATSRVIEVIASVDEEGTTIYPTFSTIDSEDTGPLLPEGYTELAYIQSDGGQYINTLFTPNSNTRVAMDIEFMDAQTAACFGSRDAEGLNAYVLWRLSTTSIRYDYGSTQVGKDISSLSGRIVIDVDKVKCTFGEYTMNAEKETFQCSNNLMLLTAISSGTVDERRTSAKLYSCRIYDDGTLVRNFVPCANPNKLNGLYDLVNEKFYANSGTGNFIAGEKGEDTV